MTDTPPTPPTPPPAPTPPAAPWYEGKADAELIGHWDNKGWKKDDPAAIAIEASKAARELQKHFGVPADQLLKLPKAEDTAGWDAVHQRFGKPAEAKEYDLSTVKFADGAELEIGFVDTMRAALHKAHVAKDAAPEVVKAVVKYLGDADAAEAADFAARLQTDRTALQQEWGTNFEFNRLTAMQGAKRLGIDQAMVEAIEKVAGYRKTMELFHRIGASTNEDTFVTTSVDGAVTTANGAKARIEELRADKAWVDRYLKGDRVAVTEMNNLLILQHGAAA